MLNWRLDGTQSTFMGNQSVHFFAHPFFSPKTAHLHRIQLMRRLIAFCEDWQLFSRLRWFIRFFFSYGMVGNLIRKWVRAKQTSKPNLTPTTIDNSPEPGGNGHADSVLHWALPVLKLVPPVNVTSCCLLLTKVTCEITFLHSARPQDIGNAYTYTAHFCEIVLKNWTLCDSPS